MSTMSAIFNDIWQFIENPRLDELSDSIGAFEVQFERYINKPTKREFVLITFYENGIYQENLTAQYWLDEFYATYRH